MCANSEVVVTEKMDEKKLGLKLAIHLFIGHFSRKLRVNGALYNTSAEIGEEGYGSTDVRKALGRYSKETLIEAIVKLVENGEEA